MPFVQRVAGLEVIAPRDGNAGGSWLAVNARGLTFCLVNRDGGFPGRRSRGLLTLGLAGCTSLEEFRGELERVELGLYPAFALVALQPGEAASLAEWDGGELTIRTDADGACPLVSSSIDQAGAESVRRLEYRRSKSLVDFHTSHSPRAGALSACMHRAGAETVSFSRIQVTESAVRMLYSPAPPCQGRQPQETILTRLSPLWSRNLS